MAIMNIGIKLILYMMRVNDGLATIINWVIVLEMSLRDVILRLKTLYILS